jgi:hypothetical protein
MKLLLLLISLLAGMHAFAQEASTPIPPISEYQSDSVQFNQDRNTIELIGHVYFKTDNLTVYEADRIIWFRDKNEIIANGVRGFAFDGAINTADKDKLSTLRYKLGEPECDFY